MSGDKIQEDYLQISITTIYDTRLKTYLMSDAKVPNLHTSP